MSQSLLIPPVLGVLGLVAAFIIYQLMRSQPAGSGKVAEIAEAIHDGAMVFMRREYTILALFAIALTMALFILVNTLK